MAENLQGNAGAGPVGEEVAFEFDRYIGGTLMAEGVKIERQPTLEKACRRAAQIASGGPNGEAPVLVLRSSLYARLTRDRDDPWRAITKADCEIATIQTFGDVTLRNSHPAWVRDADGRTYEAVWTVDDKGRGYWWDLEGESPTDPTEIYPHPLSVAHEASR